MVVELITRVLSGDLTLDLARIVCEPTLFWCRLGGRIVGKGVMAIGDQMGVDPVADVTVSEVVVRLDDRPVDRDLIDIAGAAAVICGTTIGGGPALEDGVRSEIGPWSEGSASE